MNVFVLHSCYCQRRLSKRVSEYLWRSGRSCAVSSPSWNKEVDQRTQGHRYSHGQTIQRQQKCSGMEKDSDGDWPPDVLSVHIFLRRGLHHHGGGLVREYKQQPKKDSQQLMTLPQVQLTRGGVFTVFTGATCFPVFNTFFNCLDSLTYEALLSLHSA